MLDADQGRSGTTVRARGRGGRPHRSRRASRRRFGVEALEPRWLLSGTPTDPTATTINVNGSTIVLPAAVPVQSLPLEVVPLPDELTSAHVVPYVRGSIELSGALGPEDPSAVVEIPLDRETFRIDLKLKSDSADHPLAESLRVLDRDLHELAVAAPAPGESALAIPLQFSLTKPASIFVQILPPAHTGDSDEAPGEPSPYVLDVIRVQAIPLGPSGGVRILYRDGTVDYVQSLPSVNVPPPTPHSPGTVDWVPDLEGTPATPGSPGTPASSSGGGGGTPSTTPGIPMGPQPFPGPIPTGKPGGERPPTPTPVSVPVGPLPSRSAAPLGGILAVGEPAPPIDPHEAARVDLVLSDLAPDLHDADSMPRRVVPVGTPSRGLTPGPVPVIALRGPGGIPLLATAFLAGPTTPRGALPADPPAGDEAPAPALALAPPPCSTATGISPSTAASAVPPARPGPATASRRTRRASVLPGVTLALALGVGLLLPDLVATAQLALAPRPRPRVRLGLIRRALRGRIA